MKKQKSISTEETTEQAEASSEKRKPFAVKLTTKFMDCVCAFKFGQYANEDTALSLHDAVTHEPMMVVSVNLQEYGLEPTNDWHFFLKNYSENQGILEALTNAGLVMSVRNHTFEFATHTVNFFEVKMIGALLEEYQHQSASANDKEE